MDKECLFCKFAKEKDYVWENETFYFRFDEFPVCSGHGLIIPKEHIVSLFDLTQEQFIDLRNAIHNAKKIIESYDLKSLYEKIISKNISTKSVEFCQDCLDSKFLSKIPNAYTIGNNEGIAAGRTIHHLHIQVIPRYKGDVKDFIGGIRHIIPGKGNYRD